MRDGLDLLERQSSLSVLDGLARRAADGIGQVVAVVAPAGVGKTSLLVHAERSWRGLQVWSASGREQEKSLPHGVSRSLLELALVDPDVRARVLVEAAQPATVLFAGGPGAGTHPLEHALYWTVANLAVDHPLALVIDDAHEADEASLEFLSYLARRIADLPVLLVVAMRPTSQSPWRPPLAEVHDVAVEVSLDPLSAGGVASFVEQALVGEVSPRFAEACGHATGGNPFYLSELMRDVVRRGIVPSDAEAETVGSTAPPAIVRSVLLRMAALAPGAAALARACAVLGDDCRLDHAAELAAIDLDQAAGAADALESAGVLGPGAGRLSFAHPILRSAVLHDFGGHQLARWHRRAADVLTQHGAGAAVVATHLLQTEPAADGSVASTLLRAAREAMGSGSPATAVELLRRAADEPPAHDLDTHLFELAVAEANVGDRAAIEHFAEAIAATDDADQLVLRSIQLAGFARVAGEPAGRSVDVLDSARLALEARRTSPSPPVEVAAALARYWLGRTSVVTIDRVRADVDSVRAAHETPDGPLRREAAIYRALESAMAADRAAAVAHLADAVADPGLLTFLAPDSIAPFMAMVTAAVVEEHQLLDELVAATLQACGRSGSVVGSLQATHCQVLGLLRLGHLREAEAEVLAVLESPEFAPWALGTPDWVAHQAAVHALRGDVVAGRRALDTLRVPVDVPETPSEALLLMARAELHQAAGDHAAALEDLTAVGTCADKLGIVSPGVLPWRSGAAEILVRTGHCDRARELIGEEVELAVRAGGPHALSNALRVWALVQPRNDQVATLAKAVDVAERSSSILVKARARVELGAVLRRLGQTAAARTHLEPGLDLAERCGTQPLVARARAELRAAGGRPRRSRFTGVESLTPAEARVVRLAVAGMTNTVIAQSLFVSRKTVEKHLASAYRKLDITSRSGLVGIDLG